VVGSVGGGYPSARQRDSTEQLVSWFGGGINVASDICDNSDMTLLRLVRRTGTVRFVGEGSVAYQLRATLLCYVPETLVTGHHCAVAVSVFLVDD